MTNRYQSKVRMIEGSLLTPARKYLLENPIMHLKIRERIGLNRALRPHAFIFPLFCTLVFLGCTEESPTTPQVSHEFRWEVDTIMPQSWQYIGKTLWGTSANNVYLGAFNSDGHEALVRWDGKKWTPIDLWHFGLGRNITMIDGLDSSFFIAIGDGGLWGKAARYADGRWDTLRLPRTRPYFTCVDVVSRNEIYIGCVDGILKHDGTNWEWLLDSTDSEIQNGFEFFPTSIRKAPDGNLYYVSQRDVTGLPRTKFLAMRRNKSFVVIDSFEIRGNYTGAERFGSYLCVIEGQLLTSQYGVYQLDNGVLSKRYIVPGDILGNANISGDRTNIFVAGGKTLLHFNGITWKDITPPSIIDLKRMTGIVSTFFIDKTIFVLSKDDNGKTIVYRGKQH